MRRVKPQFNRFVSVSGAQGSLSRLIGQMEPIQEISAITRDGIHSAVPLSRDQFERLMETMEILDDQKAMRALRQAQHERKTSVSSIATLFVLRFSKDERRVFQQTARANNG